MDKTDEKVEKPSALIWLFGWRKVAVTVWTHLLMLGLIVSGTLDMSDQHVQIWVIRYYMYVTIAVLTANAGEHLGGALKRFIDNVKGGSGNGQNM